MPTVVESGIEFSYAAPASFVKLDVGDHSRSGWKGVDFVIDEGKAWIWLEVSNYRYDRLRHIRISNMNRNRLFDELLGKYLGTTSFLAHKGDFVCKPLLYALILEVPSFDSSLLNASLDRMRNYVRPSGPWKCPVQAAVMNLESWNDRFPEYEARRL